MAKRSILGSFLNSAAKAADKAIKQAAKERERQAKAAEKERIRKAKLLEKARNYTITVNGAKYTTDLLANPATDKELRLSEERLKQARENNRQWERHFSYLCELKNNGNKFEKEGDINHAVNAYKQAIEYGNKNLNFANYASAIDRVAILYRKIKDYKSEIDILNFALSHTMHPNHKAKYEQRLEKVKQLIKNNQNEYSESF
jgi:tetratricopeptide (TPR) repeat protein